MTETALDLITKSLKRLNAIAGTETPTADLAADALDRLNALIETWSTESLTVWRQIVYGGVPITPVQPALPYYYIGPGADIEAIVRPPWIDAVSWLLGSGPQQMEYPLVRWTKDEWQAERMKLFPSTQSTHFYYLPDWPNGALYLWPLPSSSFRLWIYAPLAIVGPVSLTTVMSYPPGYSRALRDWLAIEMAPELGRQIDPALMLSASDALAQLKRSNYQPRKLSLDPRLPGTHCGAYDWRTDEFH